MIFGNTSGFENSGGVARFANEAGEAVQLQAEFADSCQIFPPSGNRHFPSRKNFPLISKFSRRCVANF